MKAKFNLVSSISFIVHALWYILVLVVVGIFSIQLWKYSYPKIDVNGQKCVMETIDGGWKCPTESNEYKLLKSNGCKLTGLTKTSDSTEFTQYTYSCKTGMKFTLNTFYAGLNK
ncbi:hypothetical protein [Acinetobacter seifertii]|uniref:hypothetical protein n=1 Tax=Acinetobacter seifertii TaxID=1530123 RepID=UPI000C227767|nr:hypothetical protein [Acinetobacter seifertii]PJG65528.1 hypothetical protein CVD09_15995 [Acinetobacter seifertii]